MINGIIRYFDLQSAKRTTKAEGHSGGSPHPHVLPQYISVSLGVIIEPFLNQYIKSNSWSLDVSDIPGRAIFGLIIGIVILPAVYKSSFSTDKPIAVQVIALFQYGIGWQSLFSSATKAIAG